MGGLAIQAHHHHKKKGHRCWGGEKPSDETNTKLVENILDVLSICFSLKLHDWMRSMENSWVFFFVGQNWVRTVVVFMDWWTKFEKPYWVTIPSSMTRCHPTGLAEELAFNRRSARKIGQIVSLQRPSLGIHWLNVLTYSSGFWDPWFLWFISFICQIIIVDYVQMDVLLYCIYIRL